MKAISIKQPWASLIVHGIKDIENRTWACPKKYIGQRVLIHASGSHGKKFKVNLTNEQIKVAFATIAEGCMLGNLPFGSIIGSVQIVDCTFNHSSIWAEKSKGVSPGGHVTDEKEPIIYNWVLANPILFKEPIPAKGKLSFWDYPNIDSEEGICLCQIAVDEKNQVMSLYEEYRCLYCGGKWYK